MQTQNVESGAGAASGIGGTGCGSAGAGAGSPELAACGVVRPNYKSCWAVYGKKWFPRRIYLMSPIVSKQSPPSTSLNLEGPMELQSPGHSPRAERNETRVRKHIGYTT